MIKRLDSKYEKKVIDYLNIEKEINTFNLQELKNYGFDNVFYKVYSDIDEKGNPIGKTLELREREIKKMKKTQKEIAKKQGWKFNNKDTGYLSEEEIQNRLQVQQEQIDRWYKLIGEDREEGQTIQNKGTDEQIKEIIDRMSEQLLPENEGKILKVKRKRDKTTQKLYNYYYYEEPDIEKKLIDIKERRLENQRKMNEELLRKKMEDGNKFIDIFDEETDKKE